MSQAQEQVIKANPKTQKAYLSALAAVPEMTQKEQQQIASDLVYDHARMAGLLSDINNSNALEQAKFFAKIGVSVAAVFAIGLALTATVAGAITRRNKATTTTETSDKGGDPFVNPDLETTTRPFSSRKAVN